MVFCSKGDNITPPQQSLGWILDLYDDVDEIRSYGQTIVYTIHENVGHLGIFVSSGVAKKEHDEFSSNIDLIDTLPPGLYEAVFEQKTDQVSGAELVAGEWIMRCEARTLEDIRALGENDLADERRFAAAARISEINLSLYRRFAQPGVRALMNSQWAEWIQACHPLRVQYEVFSDANPFMAPVAAMAEYVRENRLPSDLDNPFLKMQEFASRRIVDALEAWRVTNESLAERAFLSIYGSPGLQAAIGLDQVDAFSHARPQRSAASAIDANEVTDLKSQIAEGGVRECVIRSRYVTAWHAVPSMNVDLNLYDVSAWPSEMPVSHYRNSNKQCANSISCC